MPAFIHALWVVDSSECVTDFFAATSTSFTDINQRSQNLRHLYPGMGLKLGYSDFSRDQNNCDSSGAYILRSEYEN